MEKIRPDKGGKATAGTATMRDLLRVTARDTRSGLGMHDSCPWFEARGLKQKICVDVARDCLQSHANTLATCQKKKNFHYQNYPGPAVSPPNARVFHALNHLSPSSSRRGVGLRHRRECSLSVSVPWRGPSPPSSISRRPSAGEIFSPEELCRRLFGKIGYPGHSERNDQALVPAAKWRNTQTSK